MTFTAYGLNSKVMVLDPGLTEFEVRSTSVKQVKGRTFAYLYICLLHCAKKPVTTMLTYPWKCTVLHCNHLETTGADDLTLASARAIIKVSGHQHQWFPGVSQVITM